LAKNWGKPSLCVFINETWYYRNRREGSENSPLQPGVQPIPSGPRWRFTRPWAISSRSTQALDLVRFATFFGKRYPQTLDFGRLSDYLLAELGTH
jgi:hypothetical protein